jgi:hypothetical protein
VIEVRQRKALRTIHRHRHCILERPIAVPKKDIDRTRTVAIVGIYRNQIEVSVASEIGCCQSGGHGVVSAP